MIDKKQYLKRSGEVSDNPYSQSYIYGSNIGMVLGYSVSEAGDLTMTA